MIRSTQTATMFPSDFSSRPTNDPDRDVMRLGHLQAVIDVIGSDTPVTLTTRRFASTAGLTQENVYLLGTGMYAGRGGGAQQPCVLIGFVYGDGENDIHRTWTETRAITSVTLPAEIHAKAHEIHRLYSDRCSAALRTARALGKLEGGGFWNNGEPMAHHYPVQVLPDRWHIDGNNLSSKFYPAVAFVSTDEIENLASVTATV